MRDVVAVADRASVRDKRYTKLVGKLRSAIGLQAASYATSRLSRVLPRACVEQITQIVLNKR